MQIVDKKKLHDLRVKLLGCSSSTLAQLIESGITLTTASIGINDDVYTYEAVNKSDDRETKLLNCGIFVSYNGQHPNQVSIAT